MSYIDIKKDQLLRVADKFSYLKMIHLYSIKDLENSYIIKELLDKCFYLESLRLYIIIRGKNSFYPEKIYSCFSENQDKKYNLGDLTIRSNDAFDAKGYHIELQERFLIDIANCMPKLQNLDLDVVAGINTINYVLEKCKMLQKRYFKLVNYKTYSKNIGGHNEIGYRNVEKYRPNAKKLSHSNG